MCPAKSIANEHLEYARFTSRVPCKHTKAAYTVRQIAVLLHRKAIVVPLHYLNVTDCNGYDEIILVSSLLTDPTKQTFTPLNKKN